MSETTIKIEPIVITDPEKHVLLVKIAGQIDESNVDQIAQEFYKSIDKVPNGTNFIVDFKELEFINSKGIGYLLDFYKRINERGGEIVLANLAENVLDILNVVGVTRVIKTYYSLDEAKLALVS